MSSIAPATRAVSPGPVALYGGLALVVIAPLMRGGNRAPALIALEILGLVVLAGLMIPRLLQDPPEPFEWPLFALLAAPIVIGLVQLSPLPPAIWSALGGRALNAEAARLAGVTAPEWRPLSLDPTQTLAALLAAIPLLAAFLLGQLLPRRGLRLLALGAVAVGTIEVMLGIVQLIQGNESPLLFGIPSIRPMGTFANANHMANYLCMCLVLLAWLAQERESDAGAAGIFNSSDAFARWAAVALTLVVGVLLSQSRGASVFGLPAAAIAWASVARRSMSDSGTRRLIWPAILAVVVVAVAVLGMDFTTTRATSADLADSATGRAQLAALTWHGAMALFPWGSGWGAYESVFPRFQPASVPGTVNHAHMDYLELLFEGGLLFLVIAVFAAAAAFRRARQLVQGFRARTMPGVTDASSVIAGIGLVGFLLHSLVDFSMRIPANAIMAALLAGIFMRQPRGRLDGEPGRAP